MQAHQRNWGSRKYTGSGAPVTLVNPRRTIVLESAPLTGIGALVILVNQASWSNQCSRKHPAARRTVSQILIETSRLCVRRCLGAGQYGTMRWIFRRSRRTITAVRCF
jgi:hypothetical protein